MKLKQIMPASLVCVVSIAGSACKVSSTAAMTLGVPTEFTDSAKIDLTRYKEAGAKEYHGFLVYLQMGGGNQPQSSDPTEDDPFAGWQPSLDGYALGMNQHLRKYQGLSTTLAPIPEPELLAIREYSGASYAPINRYLWDISNRKKQRIVEGAVKTLASGLNKLPNFIGPVLRGDHLPERDNLAKYVPGHVVSIDTFLSTSFRRPFPGSTLFTIHSKTGKRIDWLSRFPEEAEVLFSAGSQFYVHSIQRIEVPVPSPGSEATEFDGYDADTTPSEPSTRLLIEMEQIFPDSDSKDCCSEDEAWDDSIHACRYKVDPNGRLLLPYSLPASQDAYQENNCSPGQFKEKIDQKTKSSCPHGTCYRGYPQLNFVEDDYHQCRKGKKLTREWDFYSTCKGTPIPEDYERANREREASAAHSTTDWTAFIYKLDYKSGFLEKCALAPDKITYAGNLGTKTLEISEIAAKTGLSEITQPSFWHKLKGLAAYSIDEEPEIKRSETTDLSASIYYYVKVDSTRTMTLYAKDFAMDAEDAVVTEQIPTHPLAEKYINIISQMCQAAL